MRISLQRSKKIMRAENNKRQAHIINARQRLYDLFAKPDCRERPIFTTKSGGAQATTHLSSPEHPSESFCLPLHFQCRGAPAGFEAVQKKSEGFLSLSAK